MGVDSCRGDAGRDRVRRQGRHPPVPPHAEHVRLHNGPFSPRRGGWSDGGWLDVEAELDRIPLRVNITMMRSARWRIQQVAIRLCPHELLAGGFGSSDSVILVDMSAPVEVPEDIVGRVRALCLALPEVTVRVDASLTTARSTAHSFDIRRRSFCLLVAREGSTGQPVPMLVLRPTQTNARRCCPSASLSSPPEPTKIASR